MNNTNTEEQTFPTKRDYFAAKAMQGFVSSYPEGECHSPLIDIALDSYDMADAMLEAREKHLFAPSKTMLDQLREWEAKGELIERTWGTLVEQEKEIARLKSARETLPFPPSPPLAPTAPVPTEQDIKDAARYRALQKYSNEWAIELPGILGGLAGSAIELDQITDYYIAVSENKEINK